MEGSSGGSSNPPAKTALEILQKQHEEKMVRIQELKRQIESTKLRLEEKKNKKQMAKEVSEEKKQTFKDLCEKYDFMMEEYTALLAEKSKDDSTSK